MKVLIALVHYWNPSGDGRHQSTRPDPKPKLLGLLDSLLTLRHIGCRQYMLHVGDRLVYPANHSFRNEIDIYLITDGKNTVIDSLSNTFKSCFTEIVTKPKTAKHLGYEAHAFLASKLDDEYDFYCYIEDDLMITDPLFFNKLAHFNSLSSVDTILLPHRIELVAEPNSVDRFFIDGPMDEKDLKVILPVPAPLKKLQTNEGLIEFSSPLNPHSGCFFLTKNQLLSWVQKDYWMDRSSDFISPLESAATLGLCRTFKLYKPTYEYGSWLEIQHWGNSFHCLISNRIETN